ncbi:endonuclease domain-containing protein [Urechidicola vernalis]|uniref:DUF559 domain-containing protein n=1 Tax=Urechidicola vernalis TaxID=3075600 RepID=A0ABU2Y7F7_9FLAO|nr:DUF559 domain-containing protein [Urechidicola sp. P050]MDT0554134.1 DUF559 domain-containing protein [Urechidicola sp. P050]
MKKKIHNRDYLKDRRKDFRSNLTSAEATLWESLQKQQLNGIKFRRQHSILNFIVDFYCVSEKLIIELDGSVHLDFAQQNYDAQRTEKLEAEGLTVVRFKQ